MKKIKFVQKTFNLVSTILILTLSGHIAMKSMPMVLETMSKIGICNINWENDIGKWIDSKKNKLKHWSNKVVWDIKPSKTINTNTVLAIMEMKEETGDIWDAVEKENIQAVRVVMEKENKNRIAEEKEENVKKMETKIDVPNKKRVNKKKSKKNEENTVPTATKAGTTIISKPKLQNDLTLDKLGGFNEIMKKYYTVTSQTVIYESDLNIEKSINKEFKIKGDGKKPQILIYHTHSQERFADREDKSIVDVGTYLTKILSEQFGYNVYHDKTNYDIINGKIDRSKAYDEAREGIKAILEKNPSINLVLDLHRDGVGSDTRLVTTVNDKKTAQIMFFNGMSRFKDTGEIEYLFNPNRSDNLALSLQMKLNAERYYPGFTRRNYINAYEYNLDLLPKCMLVEMGAQTNTYEEVKNAAEPLAMLIYLTMGQN